MRDREERHLKADEQVAEREGHVLLILGASKSEDQRRFRIERTS